ncbi:MAG: EthD domain-containing protein [Gammaproteobacteria bacterium]|nr:EthD domain-containing protein [Gammaproteobacteria bacterium]MYK45403.1 EthD domain-containing protein [Gammaproteobacteria bacterium]
MDQTPGAKMMYLIKRKPGTSREELVAHWFANHMPAVIQSQKDGAQRGRPHARRYFATLYDANSAGVHPWDGVAQLWWPRPLPKPETGFGAEPRDTFQQKAEPYMPWATREYVVIDGSEHLDTDPLTLNAPYPMTRSGFHKVTYLVAAKPDTDYGEFFAHWLDIHVPNVKATMEAVGGFRYVVSHSIDPANEPYAGMAELYYHDSEDSVRWRETIEADGMEKWIDGERMLILSAQTEMVGIP